MEEEPKQRTAELEALIKRTFKYAPIVQLQAVQEMRPKGDWTKTEAAKVFENDPMSSTIEIQGNRAVVRPKHPITTPSTLDAAAGSKTPMSPSNDVTNDTTTRHSSEGAKKRAQGTPKAWYQSLYEWLDAAWAAATFFAEARKKPKRKEDEGNNNLRLSVSICPIITSSFCCTFSALIACAI